MNTYNNYNDYSSGGDAILGFIDIAIVAGVIIAALITIGLIFSRLYKRASKEISFVRTGFGGEKVIMNGGALVLPVLHEIIPVNMNTSRLEVRRHNDQALITRDRMRVDVVAEFYVRVQPTSEAIANSAQTLGNRTMHREELKKLIEGKFVDALRSVAAEMSMEELHEKRTDFVQKVQQAVSEDLLKNGLELEAVSLTGLDQTGMEFFNPNNAFDAEGLTRLTEEIEQRKKIRNDIEQDTAIQIKNKNLEAEKISLEITRDEEYARLSQQREIEIRRAAQSSEIAREQAEKQREAEQAQIVAKQQIEQSRITSDRAIEEEKITKLRIIETQEINKKKQVELAEQDKAIAIADRSKAKSEAQAKADQALALAVKAEEQVITARKKETAEREKQIVLIEATKNAERDAIGIKVSAEAQKSAANDKAEALTIEANAQAEAEKLKASAAKIRYLVEAEGKNAINAAANILSDKQINMQIKLELINNLESIIRESVKPMENIDGIKIIQVDGLTGGSGNAAASAATNNNGNLADQVVNSALRYRAQAPLLDSLMKEVGINASDINGLTAILDKAVESGKESNASSGSSDTTPIVTKQPEVNPQKMTSKTAGDNVNKKSAN
jgi:uncharacterized membrane protein YqiK